MAAAAALPQVPGPGMQEMDIKTFKDFLNQYNRLTQVCFTDCVREFTSREPSDRETKCVSNCLEKFMNVTQRVSMRFQEYQVMQSEGMNLK